MDPAVSILLGVLVGGGIASDTCASMLFEGGKNIKQVSSWLGHADPAFTLRTYVHLMDDGLGDAHFLEA